MQPIDYKTISPTWIVEQRDGDNVLRPENPHRPPKFINGIPYIQNPIGYSLWSDWNKKHGLTSIPTKLSIGTYKASELT